MKNKRILLAITVFFCLLPVFGQEAGSFHTARSPININLIIDGSTALSGVRDEINTWLFNRLDQILTDGDRITVWSAGQTARVIFIGAVNSSADRETVKRNIREFTVSGDNPDFSGALREAQDRSVSGINYTFLISANPASLTNILTGPQANLLRFSKIEEFSGWRSLVVGLNIDTQVQRAAAAFMGS